MELTNPNFRKFSFENKFTKILFCIIILSILHLGIFWDHYFNHFIFPGDFGKAYYAKVAFWIAAVDEGVFPHWVPFVKMGFPFFLIVNSAFHYPFFWVFPLFNIQYTLDAAVAFQSIHILFGSIGMFVFLRSLLNEKCALVGAVAFQLFGGFFTSAAFPDFIRFFALSPWMFYVFTLNMKKPTIERKILFIPLVFYLIITGGYSGTVISSIFMMSIFIILQTIKQLVNKEQRWKTAKITAVMFALLFLGIGISTIHLGPFLQYGNELTRFHDYQSLDYETLDSVNLPTLFTTSRSGDLVGIKFLNSLYVTLPILILASFTPLSAIKKFWIFGVIAIIGILMMAGSKLLFWEAMDSIF